MPPEPTGAFSKDSMKEDVKKIAQTVIEEPVELVIKKDRLSILDKLMIRAGIEEDHMVFHLKPPTMRMSLKITAMLMDLEEAELDRDGLEDWGALMRIVNTEKMVEIVATYIHGNAKRDTPAHLINFLMDNLKDDDLERIMMIIRDQMDIVPFINSIASMRNLDVISQKTNVASLQNTGEIIAPGESSDRLQNISDSA